MRGSAPDLDNVVVHGSEAARTATSVDTIGESD